MTSKQIAFLKSKANRLKPVFQIGKVGMNENMVKDILSYLNKHELMKVSILKNSPYEMADVTEVFTNNGITMVGSIGHTVIIYKRARDPKNRMELPE